MGVMESRDLYTINHQKNVSGIARLLAQELAIEASEVEGVRVAGLLHDIRKVAIPAELLYKIAILNNEEYMLIKTHVLSGTELLKDVEFPWPVVTMIEQHHEKRDGSG